LLQVVQLTRNGGHEGHPGESLWLAQSSELSRRMEYFRFTHQVGGGILLGLIQLLYSSASLIRADRPFRRASSRTGITCDWQGLLSLASQDLRRVIRANSWHVAMVGGEVDTARTAQLEGCSSLVIASNAAFM
jgi:hypothetical protein